MTTLSRSFPNSWREKRRRKLDRFSEISFNNRPVSTSISFYFHSNAVGSNRLRSEFPRRLEEVQLEIPLPSPRQINLLVGISSALLLFRGHLSGPDNIPNIVARTKLIDERSCQRNPRHFLAARVPLPSRPSLPKNKRERKNRLSSRATR